MVAGLMAMEVPLVFGWGIHALTERARKEGALQEPLRDPMTSLVGVAREVTGLCPLRVRAPVLAPPGPSQGQDLGVRAISVWAAVSFFPPGTATRSNPSIPLEGFCDPPEAHTWEMGPVVDEGSGPGKVGYKPDCRMKHLTTQSREPGRPEKAMLAAEYQFMGPSELDAFNLPLYERFRAGPMFVSVAMGSLDLDRLVSAYRDKLKRGAQVDRRSRGGRWRVEHRQLLFELQPDLWLYLNANVGCVRVFARDAALAQETARQIVDRFRAREHPAKPGFHLISMPDGFISTSKVELDGRVRRSDRELSLLYGEDFLPWEGSLRQILRAARPGTIVLRGLPGTGKTTFIRHLMAKFARTHRFYVLSAGDFGLLTSPRSVDFWAQEGQRHRDVQKVVVLEDAESLLAERGEGRRSAVAGLLNVADGLLADFLRMKLICTANCPLERLDPAITRSGRLLAYREFTRIPKERAQRIAEAHGLSLQPQADWSLAEIFAGPPKAQASEERRVLGFAAGAA